MVEFIWFCIYALRNIVFLGQSTFLQLGFQLEFIWLLNDAFLFSVCVFYFSPFSLLSPFLSFVFLFLLPVIPATEPCRGDLMLIVFADYQYRTYVCCGFVLCWSSEQSLNEDVS